MELGKLLLTAVRARQRLPCQNNRKVYAWINQAVTAFLPVEVDKRELTEIRDKESIRVRGEDFQVDAHYFRCPNCGEEFDTSNSDHDSLAEAYDMYRKKKSMLFPLQIKKFRHKYELTQKELTALLGWGAVTLSRYENGALQSLSHDRELQEADTQAGLLRLVKLTPEAVSREKRDRLKSILLSKRGRRSGILAGLDSNPSSVPPEETNGFRRFSFEKKYLGAVEYLCARGGVLITKLNKLLFYADFLHFRENHISITGSQYAALPYGPVPNDYKNCLLLWRKTFRLLKSGRLPMKTVDMQGRCM